MGRHGVGVRLHWGQRRGRRAEPAGGAAQSPANIGRGKKSALRHLCRGAQIARHGLVEAARAIAASVLVRLSVNNSIFGISGVVFWGFLGMGMAANKYYQHQRTANSGQTLQQNSPER